MSRKATNEYIGTRRRAYAQAVRARCAQRGQGQHAMRVRGSRHGLQRPAGRRADRHLRPRRRRPLGQLLLDPRRHGPKDAVDGPLPDVEQGPACDVGGAVAHRRQVPVRHTSHAFRQRRRDAEQPCRGLSGKQGDEAVPVAVQATAQQRQRPRRGEEQVVGD